MTSQLKYAVFGVGRIGRVHTAIVLEQGHSIVAVGDEAHGTITLARDGGRRYTISHHADLAEYRSLCVQMG
jgi:hypothetical protein